MVNLNRPSYSIIYLEHKSKFEPGYCFDTGDQLDHLPMRSIGSPSGAASGFTASEPRTPILLTPRRTANSEHVTDHQVDTAKWLDGKTGIFVIWSDVNLAPVIERAQSQYNLQSPIPSSAAASFLERI